MEANSESAFFLGHPVCNSIINEVKGIYKENGGTKELQSASFPCGGASISQCGSLSSLLVSTLALLMPTTGVALPLCTKPADETLLTKATMNQGINGLISINIYDSCKGDCRQRQMEEKILTTDDQGLTGSDFGTGRVT